MPLELKTASCVDKDGYFIGTCVVNKDPMSEDPNAYILPENTLLVDPPTNMRVCARYRFDAKQNAWIEELDTSSFFRFKDHIFSAQQIEIDAIRLLLDTKLKNYTLLDIENQPVKMTFLELVDFKTHLARKMFLMKGFYHIFSEEEQKDMDDYNIKAS